MTGQRAGRSAGAAARRARAVVLALLAATALGALRAQDELGLGKMWTFERPPRRYLEQQYGFVPDAQWFETVMLATLKFGRGCSASFVSPDGLILTNQHCVRRYLAAAQGDHDWLEGGYVAATGADEVRLPDLAVQQLVRTTDVTAAMQAGVPHGASPEEVGKQLARNRAELLAKARQQDAGLEPRIVELFQGAVYELYQYRVYDDVRLVMTPHLQIAHFGGDPDNFVYPRYCVDFAFCRAYVDGKPADTRANYFKWSDGAQAGEVVFLVGNPGGTQRLLTEAQLDYLRKARYPRVRQMLENRLRILRAHAAEDRAQEGRLRATILGIENGQKLYRGEHAVLLDPAFQARKAKAEYAFRQRIATRTDLQLRYGRLWLDLAEVVQQKLRLDAGVYFHTAGGWPLLLRAQALVEFAGGDAEAGQRARDVDPALTSLHREFVVDHFERAGEWLPKDDKYLAAVLHGDPPALAVRRLEESSRLGDPTVLERLLAGGKAAIESADDPLLAVARVLKPLAAAERREWSALEAREAALGAELGQALFAVYGNEVSPDATSTLRFSDGRVLGYECNGSLAPWRTVFHGLFARHTEFDGQPPFDLPEAWLTAKDRVDLDAAVDFVCTVDSTGGNSGSPVIGRDRRFVGLLFDGNIESLANEFLYGERVERSVCVHPQAIMEALTKVYDGARIAAELRARD